MDPANIISAAEDGINIQYKEYITIPRPMAGIGGKTSLLLSIGVWKTMMLKDLIFSI